MFLFLERGGSDEEDEQSIQDARRYQGPGEYQMAGADAAGAYPDAARMV